MENERKAIEAERFLRQSRQTAAERYAELRADVQILIAMLQANLDHHAERAAEKPEAWGFAGDLGHVREQLKQMAVWFQAGQGGTETEIARAIEDQLDEVRHEA